jgi:hypothetical protein
MGSHPTRCNQVATTIAPIAIKITVEVNFNRDYKNPIYDSDPKVNHHYLNIS